MRYILTCLIIVLGVVSNAQTYSFQNYDIADGLPQTTVECVIQDREGYVWVATGGGIGKFDGEKFEEITTFNGLIYNRTTSLLEDKFGNIWIGTQGGLSVYTNGSLEKKFRNFKKKDGLLSRDVTNLALDNNGDVLIGSKGGLLVYEFKDDSVNEFLGEDSIQFSLYHGIDLKSVPIQDLVVDQFGDAWFATSNKGVFRLRANGQLDSNMVDSTGFGGNTVYTICTDHQNNIWTGSTSGVTRIILNKNREIVSKHVFDDLPDKMTPGYGFSVKATADGSVWAGLRWLIQFRPDETAEMGYSVHETITQQDGIACHAIRAICEDREGNLWLGGNTKGVSKFSGKRFEFYTSEYGMSENAIRGIAQDRDGNYWVATSRVLCTFSDTFNRGIGNYAYKFIQESRPKTGRPLSSVWSVMVDSRNTVWYGASHGCFKYENGKHTRVNDQPGFEGFTVMRIYEGLDGKIYFGAFQGTTVYDPNTKEYTRAFDKDGPIGDKRVVSFYQESDSVMWFGTQNGLFKRTNDEFEKFTMDDGLGSAYISKILPDGNGNLWLATGKGIAFYNGKKFKSFYQADGLSSDTPYLLVFDDYGDLWIGTNKGVDRLTLKDDSVIANIEFYGAKEGFLGIETNSNAGFKDRNGDMWFGTMSGLGKYNRKYDRKNDKEPLTEISNVSIDFRDTLLSDGLIVPYGHNYLSFDWQAISLTRPEKTRYQFKLEGYDDQWSPAGAGRHTNYSSLPAGDYEFKVKACNERGVWNVSPSVFKFTVETPFWQRIWFYLLCAAVVYMTARYFYLAKTKKLQRQKDLLERKVQERTSQLQRQNEKLGKANDEIIQQKFEIENKRDELEIKNKEITDSILYAKHIQSSILPSLDEVKEMVPKSFVLFNPKDIVSGDFYYVESVEDEHILAAVDCTGHGVPGALMSVVGNNLLNRAIRAESLRKPSEILDFIDQNIHTTLRHNSANNNVADGMDLALVRLDLKNKKVEFSGAYNPLYLIRNNELSEFKGDRMAIGDMHRKATVGFSNAEVNLMEGDMLYLFSDGYIDQFGGTKGKKYKSANFKKLLLECSKLSPEEQKARIGLEFEKWRGDIEQVDDVCVIGIRV